MGNFDVFDILAVILGVIFTIRKLDAQRREHKEFPHVDPKEFADWQAAEVHAYGLGMFCCFAKLLADVGFHLFFVESVTPQMAHRITMTIDLPWMVVMVVTFVRRHQLARRRAKLRIVLGGLVIESKGSELSRELKEALMEMEDGRLDKALYMLKQVTLDDDESLRGIALYWMGECYLRQGETDAARDAFQESVETDPSLTQPQEALARLNSQAESAS